MGSMSIKKLTVKYNGRVVGYLAELEEQRIAFQYDEERIKTGFSISPFSLPLSSKIYINKKQNFDGLFGVFYDSLPDGRGQLVLSRMLVNKGINPNNLTPLDRLSLVNDSGLGGLSYEPTFSQNDSIEINSLDEIAREVKALLDNNENLYDLDKIYILGGSSGGARPKVHIKLDGEYWIIKFPCSYDPQDIGLSEFKANEAAKACEINVNEHKLFNSKICFGYFGSKRFDRNNEKRIHTISLSSLLETSHRIPNLDYMHLFQVIQNICVDQKDILEAYKRMCFNVLYGNKDDHGKNFSFLYDEKKKGYVLSPAYDLTRTPNNLEHEMTVNGNGNPSIEDLLNIGKNVNLSEKQCKDVISKIEKIIKN